MSPMPGRPQLVRCIVHLSQIMASPQFVMMTSIMVCVRATEFAETCTMLLN